MRKELNTNGLPTQIEVDFYLPNPEQIRVMAYDRNQPKIILWDWMELVVGPIHLTIKMPLSPNTCVLLIYNDLSDPESNFDVKIQKKPLHRDLTENAIGDTLVREFVILAERFAFNFPYLDKEETYYSQGKHYAIEYLTQINDPGTPARIRIGTGLIQVNAQRFDSFICPMAMAVLMHEFSHTFLNNNPDDEMEADINGLVIYLGLGFPLAEAYKAFANILSYTPTNQNSERTGFVEWFLNQYNIEKAKK